MSSRARTALGANTNPTGGDPVVEAICKQVDDATAKAARVTARGTRISPPPGAANPPANVVPAKKGVK